MSVTGTRSALSHSAGRQPIIATVLTPLERVRVDVASEGVFEVLHRGSVEEMAEDVRAKDVDAVILSVARYDTASTARMAAMVREFPTVPTFALLTEVQRSTPHSMLELGRVGVRTLIKVRTKLLQARSTAQLACCRSVDTRLSVFPSHSTSVVLSPIPGPGGVTFWT